ncbi:trifunctional serine/threonine-protein kinase/ATP-binding protein/sensor histidine kinase [Nostoc sp.]|uniref:trifunctional serine/threonine-protein kinase/ATP-binding protein/sensor histidine kinase n=2 Tax=Nostoc sp. TaxID=1180 RepID=UPI002FF70112
MVSTFVSIPGYRIGEELYNGSRTLVYRGVRETDSLPVVIKLLKNSYPTFSELLSFRNQYTIAKNLNSPLIVQTYSLEPYQNGYALVMEDFGGISLKDWGVGGRGQSLQEFLVLAIALCNTLDILYHERIIHKDIKPANILINPETKQVKLIDFSIASLLPRETQTLLNPNVLEGTLAYISPEQTGRMNRGIDYRTDFYSLGVTFYELLTGELPFASNDPMELVHSHIAKLPPNMNKSHSPQPSPYQGEGWGEVDFPIPQVLCDIVMKLMAKNAEDRYQGALGLKFDLENCLHQLQVDGMMNGFEIAQRDVCDRFLIPDKLYGRETEVSTLLQAFERVSLGATEMMLVAGFSGIGKTVVVNEVHKPIVRQRGYFIKGKYDQFNRNIPFSAFVQAFRDLMGQLLTESDIQLETWRNQILDAVGENGQVITEVIPELSRIIGEQLPAIELSGTAAQNRFNLLFQKFTQVFTSDEHPLVIFLDDLQWADSASLKLMQLLMTDTSHLLLIGAYRDNEVNPGHPLMLTLSEIQKNQATINRITLAQLSQIKVNQLVADTLKCSEDLAWTLSQLIYQKTQGNPFFATQFLKSLHQENLIKFDLQLGCWQCDIAQVSQQAVTDDVVAFMALQLRKLSRSTQEVLQLAACIGNQFDLATVAIVSQQSQIDTAANLWKALQSGLILPISDVYKFYQDETANSYLSIANRNQQIAISNEQLASYKFLHDRVQQAAYSLIPDDQKTVTHLQIGQLLLENFSEVAQEEKLFDIVNHLNIGKSLINQPSERTELAQLNLTAGRKAKYATAYSAAIAYFTTGIELLEQDCWRSHYELTLTLHEATAEVAYLIGQFAEMEAIATITFKYGKTLLDKIPTYDTQIQAYLAQNRLTESIQTSLNVLNQLGIQFPKNPNTAQTLLALAKTKLTLGRKKASDLWQLPTMSDPEKLAAMRILSSACSAAFIGVPKVYPLLIFQQVNLSVKYGNIPLSVCAYAAYGMILSGVLVDIDGGYEFGQLALQMLEKFNAKDIRSNTLFAVNCFISHWKQHLRSTLPGLQEAYEVGLETGDVEFSAWAAVTRGGHLYWSGHELSGVEKTLYHYGEAVTQSKQHNAFVYINIYRQVVLNLLNEAPNPSILEGSVYSEAQNEIKVKGGDFAGVFLYHVHQIYLSYLFGEFSNAAKQATIAKKYVDGGTSTALNVPFCFYDSLARLALYPNSTKKERSQILQHVSKNQKKMQKWAGFAPMNTLHKFHLVEAERHRVLKQWTQAQEMYDRAITLAKANEYIQEEALANELAAKFYLDWGKEKVAFAYMQEAYYCYARWGAKAKVIDLETHYPQLLVPILQQPKNRFNPLETFINITHSPTQAASKSISETLDFASIIKASQTLSSEIELEKLFSSLLKIVIENAGADKCVLMLMRDERLLIKGSITEGTNPVVLQRIPVEDSQDIPLKLIYKVLHDSQTAVVLDATADLTLANDPYIMRQQPYSILCSPILHQGKLLGILYLENNLVKGAFTSDRVELLNLLCAQAAISLENARLFHESKQAELALQEALTDLQNAQLQMVQSEKMSALGNLVAGVAHEMNNPLGFIAASLEQAKPTFTDIIEHLKIYQETLPNKTEEIIEHAENIDLDYSLSDLPKMIDSMSMACDRLKNISISLRTFSRADRDYKVPFNIHEGIESTILILKHRLKANEQRPAIEVVTNYGDLPQVECFPGQLNQVFMNLIANAIDALDESNTGRRFEEIKANPNCITITTSVETNLVKIAIMDNGKGMSEQVKSKVFDHLFTTKAVGKGTGLGLAIARQIVEETHGGKLSFNSVLGEGTEFIIEISV